MIQLCAMFCNEIYKKTYMITLCTVIYFYMENEVKLANDNVGSPVLLYYHKHIDIIGHNLPCHVFYAVSVLITIRST